MKLKHNSIFLALALVAAGCSESQDIVDNPNATPGEEVQFGSSLADGLMTRTVYGSRDGDAYPVYWVQDDKVIVTSPQCMSGYNNREYSINVNSETQNYATGSLQKTSDTGIRWSDEASATADFYSIYPSKNATATDETLTKFTLHMPEEQHITLKTTTTEDAKGNSVVSHNDYDAADMDGCFMWAKKANVASGSTVNLQYQPFSTALRFKLRGPKDANASPVTVQSVVVSAANGVEGDGGNLRHIAGDFSVELKDMTSTADGGTETIPPISEITDTEDAIKLVAQYENGTYLTLAPGEEAQLNVFIIPQEYTSIEGWTITVNCSDGATFTKTINNSDLNGSTKQIEAGKVHDLGYLPYLSESDDEWDPSNWMTNIDDDTYLSEVSIPGSWNSLNSNFQSDTSLEAQYNAGCRAFHLDTRWKGTQVNGLVNSYVKVNNIGELGVADGSTAYNVYSNAIIPTDLGEGRVMGPNASTFASALTTITSEVKSDEYMVVMCTFANDSYAYNGSDGWIKAISEACEDNGKVIDARTINSETTVGEVEGSVIVIVCTQDQSLTLPEGSKCLLTYLPMEQSNPLASSNNTLENAGTSAGLKLYGTHAQVTSNTTSGISTYERGYAPTIDERKTVLNKILAWSKNNYVNRSDDYAHNEWMYLGLGGYEVSDRSADEVSNSSTTLANDFNPWITGIIDGMADDKTFYPVGIVMMNHICKANGTAAAKEIILLHRKYVMRKKSSASTSSSVKTKTQPAYTNGGNAISH